MLSRHCGGGDGVVNDGDHYNTLWSRGSRLLAGSSHGEADGFGSRFEHRLSHMVTFFAVKDFDVEVRSRWTAKARKILPPVQCSFPPPCLRETDFGKPKRPSEKSTTSWPAFHPSEHKPFRSVSIPSFVPGLDEGLAQRNADIFYRWCPSTSRSPTDLISGQKAVLGKQGQHVIEEMNACGDLRLTNPIQIEL